ncbi:MAG TPA: beta-ketoacyl-ACP synthase [Xanthobacteraceae bacterium]|nr:beta-ketoacyl-ACP synthase [Xanthobacteraceae bacterium]
MPTRRDTWITGVGILSSLGEGAETHRRKLMAGEPPVTDTATIPGYVVHPLAKVIFDTQIPKKGDQRQMEPWQRIGTYAAGLALTEAGVAGKSEILSEMDMIVAAGGGERDIAVDCSILTELRTANDPEARLNARLQTDLRPTLFLAQLSNLLAGNISIVHGVVGSSRTFMGEESAGIEAMRVAQARIAAGQSEIALIGAGYNGERADMMLLYEFARLCLRGAYAPVFSTGRAPGIAAGSVGTFLVLESRAHAQARGAKPIARLAAVHSSHARREPGGLKRALAALIENARGEADPASTAIFSAASGAEPATSEEAEVLKAVGLPVRAVASRIGHGFEGAFPAAVALAALAVNAGKLYAAMDAPLETPGPAHLRQAIITCAGHWRGEGVGVVEAVD